MTFQVKPYTKHELPEDLKGKTFWLETDHSPCLLVTCTDMTETTFSYVEGYRAHPEPGDIEQSLSISDYWFRWKLWNGIPENAMLAWPKNNTPAARMRYQMERGAR